MQSAVHNTANTVNQFILLCLNLLFRVVQRSRAYAILERNPENGINRAIGHRYNDLRSALLQLQGPPAQVLMTALASQNIRLCVSEVIYAECEEVIRQPRFLRTEDEISAALRRVSQDALWVKPSPVPTQTDDMFLECAQASQMHFLVTGNTKHFPSR